MGFTPEQIKGRIKSVAKQNNADARTLMRIYMMERFLERLAQSEYRDNFIIKGGILVTAMIGVAHRSTMDIDTSMKNLNLSAEDALRVVNQVKDIDLDDGVSFEVKDVSNIMDEMEYACGMKERYEGIDGLKAYAILGIALMHVLANGECGTFTIELLEV